MSVYDFNYEDDVYRPAGTHSAAQSGPRWVEGYSVPSEAVSHGSGLKLRVSNRRIIGLVAVDCLCLFI